MKLQQQHRVMWLRALSASFGLHACGGKLQDFDQSAAYLEEIQPDNQGYMQPFVYPIAWNHWNEKFKQGDLLLKAVRYDFDETLLPKDLSLEMERTTRDISEFRLPVQAQHHHVNDAVVLPLTFFMKAFFGSSEKVFTRHPREISL